MKNMFLWNTAFAFLTDAHCQYVEHPCIRALDYTAVSFLLEKKEKQRKCLNYREVLSMKVCHDQNIARLNNL